MPLQVARTHLLGAMPIIDVARSMDDHERGALMFTGRVTFCELVPMRSVPFDVVCLVGMNDGSYPRSEPRLGFDLMARATPKRSGPWPDF